MVTTRFGAYEILQELSSGGMGSVLLGRRRGPGAFEQLVAIKTIRSEYAGAEAVRAMFLDEAAILARLNHPGVATVHDFGEEGGTLYMVMEYVAGVSFRALADLQLPPGVIARAIAEACRGLHAAHELRDLRGQQLGLVHRDISPDNLMLGYDGHVKVIDFGIALVKNRQAPVTEFGTVKGKPPYMSPEQLNNERMDRRSDVFSLGVVLHEMLTGRPLFEGNSIYAVAMAVQHQEITPPSLVTGRALPIGLDAVVMNALDRDPARRTPSAAALAEQLEEVIAIAGDETLEAWAERELAAHRAAHRGWLARVVTGTDAPPPLGRPSGARTVVAGAPGTDATQLATPARAAIPAGDPPVDHGTPTHLPAFTGDDLDSPRRMRRALPILLGLIVLLAAGGGAFWLFGRRSRVTGPSFEDAAILADAAAPTDATVARELDAAEPDAAIVVVPVDAGRIVRTVVDAGVRTGPRDAAVIARPRPDAAVVIESARTFGKVTIKHRPDGPFLNVIVDGKLFGVSPLFGKQLATGAHTVELVAPDSGQVVHRAAITVEDGKTVTVTQP